MKRNMFLWIAMLILSLVGITLYGGVISYGFFYTILLVPIFSLLYLLYVYVCFRIYQYTDGRDFVVNNAVSYSFRLINEFYLPFVGIRVRFFSPFSTINGLSDETEYELMPKTGITRETSMVCHYRGEYEIGIKEVEIQDYLRLFSIKYKNKEAKRVTVDPQLITLTSLGSIQLHSQDAQSNPSKLDIVGRDYVLGDDVRFINWSQTARANKLMTRERIGEDGRGVSIIMDACRYSKDPFVYLPSENKVMELTLAISLFFCNKNIASSEYHYNRSLIKYDIENSLQFEGYYRQMAALCYDSTNTQQALFEILGQSEQLFGSAVVYMVMPVWTEYADEMVTQLAKRNIYVIVYIISDKPQRLPDVSRIDLIEVNVLSPEDKLDEVLS